MLFGWRASVLYPIRKTEKLQSRVINIPLTSTYQHKRQELLCCLSRSWTEGQPLLSLSNQFYFLPSRYTRYLFLRFTRPTEGRGWTSSVACSVRGEWSKKKEISSRRAMHRTTRQFQECIMRIRIVSLTNYSLLKFSKHCARIFLLSSIVWIFYVVIFLF